MHSGGGYDVGYVFRHPIFLVTFIIAIPSWIIAFAGQCAAEAKYSSSNSHAPVAGTLWFTIWLELLCLASDGIAFYRFQLSIFLAIATALAIFGVQFLFQSPGSFIATGVGWLLLTIVNLIWLLYLTSEQDTFIYSLLNSGGNGGLSGNRRIGGPVRRDSTAGYGGGEMGMGGSIGGMGRGISSNNMNGGGYAPAATEGTPQKASAVIRDNYNAGTHVTGQEDVATFKQRANGKWYQVRTSSGATGIAPSNYLVML
ncbi:uncharacterized protein L203_105754 [Cryptococcus depauperatus CBS 7841]|uniref:SH3 domain-containing protein n=1 Tax=Cryptococcus depauperatus CBS 7841 TaxID=1295531 RepID=A0AAJ8JXX0_9TREE